MFKWGVRNMNSIAPIFMLCGDYYDESPAKKDFVETEWLDETISKEEKLEFWKRKFDRGAPSEDDGEIYGVVRVPAPMEKQPYWDLINCEEFVKRRMVGYFKSSTEDLWGLKNLSKYKDVRTHGCMAQLYIPYTHDDWIGQENSEIAEYRAEIHLGKLTQVELMSWLRLTESDLLLYDYYMSDRKGTPPKEWHDTYALSEDLCPFDEGDYMSDGEYWDGPNEETLYIASISNDELRRYDDGSIVDGW